MAHENSNKTQTTRRNLENYLTYKMKKNTNLTSTLQSYLKYAYYKLFETSIALETKERK